MTAESQAPDLNAIKERQQETWAAGNYARTGNNLVMGELLCEVVDPRAGQKVLDIVTGSGSADLSATRRGCEVRGMDYAQEWVEYARKRAVAEQMEISFDVGYSPPLASCSPRTRRRPRASCSGVQIRREDRARQPDPRRFCRQHVSPHRQTRPSASQSRAAPLWGTEERLRELFGEEISSLDMTRHSYVIRYPSAKHLIEHFRSYFGPMRKVFEARDDTGQDALAQDLEELPSPGTPRETKR